MTIEYNFCGLDEFILSFQMHSEKGMVNVCYVVESTSCRFSRLLEIEITLVRQQTYSNSTCTHYYLG